MPIHVRSKRPANADTKPVVPAAKTGGAAGLLYGLPQPAPGKEQVAPGISLCMIVKNEERFLAQALHSAQDAVDEIIVVDTGSTDRTIEIAKSFGAIVVEREWRNDFAWARNQALEQASKRWILVLDADEEIMPNSKSSLIALKNVPADRTALWVRIYNRSDDYQGTGDMSHALIRVFPNDPKIRYRGLIHEFATYDNDPNGLNGVPSPIGVVHHGYVKEVVEGRGKGARNLAIVKAAAEKEPDDAFHWFNLGTTAFLCNDYETARDALEKMRTILGKQHRGFVPNGLAVLAETYCDKLDDPVKGESIARAALEFSPHYANAHFQLGKALIAQKRFDDGRAAYLEAIEDGKYAALQYVIDDQVYIWKAHSEIGSSYVMQKNDEKALEWFDKGLKNAPNAEPLHINRARALERLGRIPNALESYRTVYELHRTSPQSTIEYVNALLRNNRADDALSIVDQTYATFAAQWSVPLLMAAAAVAQKRGSFEDERYLEAAAAMTPGASEILDPLEVLLRARGKAGEVANLIAREEAVPPQSAGDYLRRARRAIERGEFETGRELSEAGLALAPDHATLHYALGLALSKLGDRDRALAVLGAVHEGPADTMTAIAMLKAALYRAIGNGTQALAATEQVLTGDPNHVQGLLLKAKLLEELGSPSEAEEPLKRAFALDRAAGALELSAFYLRSGRIGDAAAVADLALQT
ncbi:MAG TPA: glycosyltransferase [Candidatus Baltobacteraceae bacterium]|jgi:tetratricopeptide (TPR) repeat protein|nr:glycosyltransferase [Candidatus Baltobacteraceae bacterium]